MRKIYALTLLYLCVIGAHAQVNINTSWTWMGGQKHIPMRAVPGVKGSFGMENSPSARKDAVNWVDASGNNWMFGGYGHGSNGEGLLNDLWKYNNTTNQWAWVNGDLSINSPGVYGTQGVASSANMPSGRYGSGVWVGNDGNFYLFGGLSAAGRLNDLWRYNPTTNEWTWVNGPSSANTLGVYGTAGVAAASNRPGARNGATVWKGSGNLIWLFGGDGANAVSGATRLNDLWKYDAGTDQWTWMNGSNGSTSVGASFPEARNAGNTAWKDNTGNLYLFGGAKNGSFNLSNPPCGDGCPGYTLLGDFWKYNVSNNTWTSLNLPSNLKARFHGLAWTDAAGMFWLFGGYGFNPYSAAFPNNWVESHMNDVWKYNPANNGWTKISGDYGEQPYGTYNVMGVTSAANMHGGSASGVSWRDNSTGKLYSFGGQRQEGSPLTWLNDVWSYDPATNLHTWLKGDSISRALPTDLGPGNPLNMPGERKNSGGWADNNGNLYIFGGDDHKYNSSAPGYYPRNDFWKYSISGGVWSRVSGGPGGRQNMNTQTDASGNLWLFGGQGFFDGTYNDLWKYVPSTDTWSRIKGSASAYSGSSTGAVYGTQGVPAATNNPGARELAMFWKDNAGNFWLFGGRGFIIDRYYSDLWKYDVASNMWTWVSGPNTHNQFSNTYTTLGVEDINNRPGARVASAAWTDNAGNLWMFGGYTNGYSSDLWKYNTTTGMWTCFTAGTNTSGVYGTKGTAAATNIPGARSQPSGWTDAFGNFWLMGGGGFDKNGAVGNLNDVWMFNVSNNQWTWVKGDDVGEVAGIYGTKGIPNPANKPGGRYGGVTLRDAVGDIWLYGGNGYAESGLGRLPDLWRLASPALAPLPVHLLEFKGRLVNDNGVLNWKTENEMNASSYIVERSLDRKNYTPVGTVIANNSNGSQLYSFTDANIASLGASVIYYRLKQKDLDGKSTYSNIVALTIDKSLLVMMYPNPVTQTANVTITINRIETVNVKVINGAGAVVKQLQWKLTSGSTSNSIDLSVLSKGAYYLDISGETISKKIGFVKQ